MVAELLRRRSASVRSEIPFEIILSLPDPVTLDLAQEWEAEGVTGLICRPWADALRSDVGDLAAQQRAGSIEFKIDATLAFGEDVVARASGS